MRTSNKSELTKILIGDNFCTVLTNPQEKPECRVIDGMALLRAIVKPKVCRYWNDWMIAVNSKIKEQFTQTCRRVDIVFDSYDRRSTKSSCRNNRAKNSTQYGRIEPHMKFPNDMSGIFSSNDNKRLLQEFVIAGVIEAHDPRDGELIIAGGKCDTTSVKSTLRGCISSLRSSQEEADCRLLLHVLHSFKEGYDRIVVRARDTDVLVILLQHLKRFPADAQLWLQYGTSKSPCYIPIQRIPIHLLREKLLG